MEYQDLSHWDAIESTELWLPRYDDDVSPPPYESDAESSREGTSATNQQESGQNIAEAA